MGLIEGASEHRIGIERVCALVPSVTDCPVGQAGSVGEQCPLPLKVAEGAGWTLIPRRPLPRNKQGSTPQVPEASRAAQAERQRRPTANPKTGVRSQGTFCQARAAAAHGAPILPNPPDQQGSRILGGP